MRARIASGKSVTIVVAVYLNRENGHHISYYLLVWRSHTLSETGEGLVCVASGSCARGMFRYVTI